MAYSQFRKVRIIKIFDKKIISKRHLLTKSVKVSTKKSITLDFLFVMTSSAISMEVASFIGVI